MKLYQIKIVDRKTNEVLVDTKEIGTTKKIMQIKYAAKYRFHENVVSIEIETITRKPDVQMDIFQIIDEQNG